MFTSGPADIQRLEIIRKWTEAAGECIPYDATDVTIKLDWEVKSVNEVDQLVPNVLISYKLS